MKNMVGQYFILLVSVVTLFAYALAVIIKCGNLFSQLLYICIYLFVGHLYTDNSGYVYA